MIRKGIRVFGNPVAQPRPRATARGGFARVYNPSTADEWKDAIRLAAIEHGETFDGPVSLAITFYMPKPKRHKAGSQHMTKPDLDNLVKAVMDALTKAGWWKDDCQVVSLVASKHYEMKGQELPGAHICALIYNP